MRNLIVKTIYLIVGEVSIFPRSNFVDPPPQGKTRPSLSCKHAHTYCMWFNVFTDLFLSFFFKYKIAISMKKNNTREINFYISTGEKN